MIVQLVHQDSPSPQTKTNWECVVLGRYRSDKVTVDSSLCSFAGSETTDSSGFMR